MNVNLETFQELGLAGVEAPNPQKQELGQAQFLELMTTQLTHQNPLDPMENGEFLSQIAQFGTVSGIQDLQNSFKEFAASITSGQALQASSLVGKYISAPSREGLLTAGGEIKGQFDLPGSSPNVNVKILDPITGELIRNLDLGGHPKGSVPFVWDGLAEDGSFANPGVYEIQAEAKIDGVNTALETQIQSLVESVVIGNGNNGLLVNRAGLEAINFNAIKQIL